MRPELIIEKFSRHAGVLYVKNMGQIVINTARKRWTKEENKTAITCYLIATKES